jgi:hypothetical protein
MMAAMMMRGGMSHPYCRLRLGTLMLRRKRRKELANVPTAGYCQYTIVATNIDMFKDKGCDRCAE